jgi:hypothetical protein
MHGREADPVKLIAVDPWNCGCTECMIGEYVALHSATDENMADLFAGRLANHLNTGTTLEVVMTYETVNGTMGPRVDSVTVRYEHWNGETKEWRVDPYRAGFAK